MQQPAISRTLSNGNGISNKISVSPPRFYSGAYPFIVNVGVSAILLSGSRKWLSSHLEREIQHISSRNLRRFSVSGLPAGAATAVADAIAQANAVAQSLGSGITFSTTSSIGVAISNINFLGTPGAAPVLWNCGDAVSCNAQELNSSGYAVSSSIFVQLAQGCGSVACFADVGSTAFNGAIYAVLMHEMLHNLAAPDVDSDADVMGFFVGTNDVGNSAD